MEFVAVVLAALGVIFIVLGWKRGNSNLKNAELLTALKGIANLKKEVSRMDDVISSLEKKIEQQEPPLFEDSSRIYSPNLINSGLDHLNLKIGKGNNGGEKEENVQKLVKAIQQMNDQTWDGNEDENEDQNKNENEKQNNNNLSPVYQTVLDLVAQGMGVQEISYKLGLSQDAVNMVLLTSARGGKG